MRVNFFGTGCISPEQEDENVAYALSLGLPELGTAGRESLAIIGGGPSIQRKREALQTFEGDRWAINGAFHWCREHDIQAEFMTIDPQVEAVPLAVGAEHAVLATCCHPELFDSLREVHVRAFGTGRHGWNGTGPSSAVAAAVAAAHMGYRKITFFGCESCYVGDSTHAYMDYRKDTWLRVKVGAEEFLTDVELLMQAEILAEVIHHVPTFYGEQSGGLLRALVADPTWDASEFSPVVQAMIA